MNPQKKVGIFGGSFDPVHLGHLNFAIAMQEACQLDEVLFVPAGLSPFKEATPPVASTEHRLKMVQLALPPIHGMKILDWELSRPGPSFTIDTVRRLVAENPTYAFHLLIAEDLLPSLDRWKEAEELIRLSPPLVGSRHALGTGAQVVQIPVFDVSSTAIRERLRKGLYCGHLVPGAVLEYIAQFQLYKLKN